MYMYSVLFRFFSPAFLTWKEGRKGQGAGQSFSVLVISAAFISIPEGAKRGNCMHIALIKERFSCHQEALSKVVIVIIMFH